jgi:hypothetical protein
MNRVGMRDEEEGGHAMVAACLVYVLCVVAAVIATGPRFRPALAAIAGVGASTCALLVPAEHTFARFLFTALGFVVVMRILDLRIDRRAWSTRMRVWLFTGVVDVREARPIPRRTDTRPLVAIALYLALAGLGWWLARDLWRWGGGVLLIYGLADAVCGVAVPLHALFGWQIPRQHRAPILATSVSAFWSTHYNLNVSRWLARHFHRALARRGRARLGVLLAFGVSALVHAIIAWVCLDLPMALAWFAFFGVQGIAAALERSWPGFANLPVLARRVWTIAWLLLPSPLFVEPFLRILQS